MALPDPFGCASRVDHDTRPGAGLKGFVAGMVQQQTEKGTQT
jgi:hypothetical protein